MFNCFSILKLFTGTDVGEILKYAVIIIAILAVVFLFVKVEGVRWFVVIAIVLVVGFSGVYSGIKINQYYSAQGGIYGKLEDLIKSNQVEVEQSKTYINFNFSNVNLTENNYGYYSARFVSNDTITLDSNSQYFATVNSMPCKIVEYDKYHFVAKYNYSFYDEQNNYILTDELTFTFGMSQYVTELVVTSKNEDTRAVELWNVYFTKNDFIVKLETTDKVYISDSDMVTLSVYNQSEIAYQSVVPIGSSVILDLSKFNTTESYRPVGFSYDPEGINRIEDNTLVVDFSQRVYVVWEFFVHFYDTPSHYHEVSSSWISNGTLLSEVAPSTDGLYDNWRFLGWSIDGENIIDVTKTRFDCSYYWLCAIWDKGTQVTFYDYYDEFSYGLVYLGDTLESVIPEENPYEYDKKFLGWSLSNDNDVNKIVDLSTIVFDGTQTSIYPVYEEAKTIVTFMPGATKALFEGDELSSKIPSNPEVTGYKFVGWSLTNDNDANSVIDLTTYTLTGDTTFYAVWSAEIMTVNFHLEGGSADFNGKTYSSDFSEVLLYNEEFNLTNLFKENCTFYDFSFKFLPVTTASTSLIYNELPLTSSLEKIFDIYIASLSGESDDTEPGETREYHIYEFTSCEVYITFLANSIEVSSHTDSELADYIGVNTYGDLAGSLDGFLSLYLVLNCGYSPTKVNNYDYATKLQYFQDSWSGSLTIEDDTTERDVLEQIYLYYFYENNSVSVTFLVDDANYSSASVLKGS